MLKRFQRCILIERRAHTSNICQPIAVSICALHCFLFGWFVWFAVGLILLNYYGLELVYSCIIVFFVLFYFCPFHRGIFCHLYVWSIMGLTFASIHFYVERRRHFLSVQSDLTHTTTMVSNTQPVWESSGTDLSSIKYVLFLFIIF